MQFQVPQFIETEDRLIGPLTLRQFIYIAIAGAISAMLYFTVGGIVSIIIAFFLFAIGIAFAFGKVEGRPLFNVVVAAATFYWKPQTYVWQPNHPMISSPGQPHVQPKKTPIVASIQKVASGTALHKSWESLQTGAKISDRQLVQSKMEARYQIFSRNTGDRRAARRIDYR